MKQEELQIFADRIVLFLHYEVSEPRFTSDLRERFDRDSDRTLSSDEREALAQFLLGRATEGLQLRWDGDKLNSKATLRASSGLDRELPTAYPITFYWQLDFILGDRTEQAMPESRSRRLHELHFEDTEARWNSPFQCRIRLAPGVEDGTPNTSAPSFPRSFEFPKGQASFRIAVSVKAP